MSNPTSDYKWIDVPSSTKEPLTSDSVENIGNSACTSVISPISSDATNKNVEPEKEESLKHLIFVNRKFYLSEILFLVLLM